MRNPCSCETLWEEHSYSYDARGRMVQAVVDKTGSGGSLTTVEYACNDQGLRLGLYSGALANE